jgi:acetyltransferase-like isoleucine patch superfamily enzyme
VIVGKRAVVVAQAELSGSVEIGEGAWIGPSACVIQRTKIGAYALVGLGSVVLKDVEPNTTVAGNPARVINDQVGVREVM